MKRWISAALCMCLLLIIGAYGGVYWYLQSLQDPVNSRLRDETPIAALATPRQARPRIAAEYLAAEYAERNILSRKRSEPRRLQQASSRDEQPRFVSDLGFASNLDVGNSGVNPLRNEPQVELAQWGNQGAFEVADAAPKFVANNSPGGLAPPTNAAPPNFAPPPFYGDQDAVSRASHQQTIPSRSPSLGSGFRDPSAPAPNPAEMINPFDGMKIAVLVSSTRQKLPMQVEQRMLGGKAVQVAGAGVSVPTAEIKIYAQSVNLSNDKKTDSAAVRSYEPQQDEESPAEPASKDQTERNLDDETESRESHPADVEASHSDEPREQADAQPAPDPAVEFEIVCDGKVVVLTPNGLIRGEGLSYAKGQFKVGSAVIENPDTVITAGEITFPFEIGNLQVFPLASPPETGAGQTVGPPDPGLIYNPDTTGPTLQNRFQPRQEPPGLRSNSRF